MKSGLKILEDIDTNYLNYLKECGVYYLGTIDGDQPKLRPFGTIDIYEGKLYIQTGKIKPTSKQLAENKKAEICAFCDGAWVRIACELIEDDRVEARKSMLDAYPNLRGMYDENDGNTMVLYMENATATYKYSPMLIKKSYPHEDGTIDYTVTFNTGNIIPGKQYIYKLKFRE